MRILVVGPGALGSLLCFNLVQAGYDVRLLCRRTQSAETINKCGVTLEYGDQVTRQPVRATTEPVNADIIFLCVKSYDVPGALKSIETAGGEGLLVALQNGIAHHDWLKEHCRRPWAIGITSQGATLLSPGRVRHGGEGKTFLGWLHGSFGEQADTLLCQAKNALNSANFAAEITEDIRCRAWAKLLINVGINGLTAIFDCPNGALLEIPEAEERLERAVLEAAEVASAMGIMVPGDPVSLTKDICKATRINISSMLQDVRHRKKTEIAAINGAIIRYARKCGIKVPENEKICREVENIEKIY